MSNFSWPDVSGGTNGVTGDHQNKYFHTTRNNTDMTQIITVAVTTLSKLTGTIEGLGACPAFVKFWANFYFCSDLPNFWHELQNILLIAKKFCIFSFGFLFVSEK